MIILKIIHVKIANAVLAAILFVLFSVSSPAAGEEALKAAPPPAVKTTANELGGRCTVYGDLGGRVNPDGLSVFAGVNYRNVYAYDDRHDTASGYWQTGLGAGASPAMMTASAHFEWLPIIILPVRIQYDYYGYFGANNALLSFSSPDQPYGDEALDNRADEEAAGGHRFLLQPTLQLKFDRIVIRNQTDAAYYLFSGRGPYFLEPVYDTLLKDGDFLFSNRTFLLYSIYGAAKNKTLLAGPYYEITRAFDTGINQQKIGLSVYWDATSQWFISRPYIAVTAGCHLQDPNRRGELFFSIGTGFQFDL